MREMVERALASTPEDIVRLHGLMRPADQPPVPPRPREKPATELETTIDGRTFRLGDRLVLRLAGRIDTYDRMLDGRTATLERIYIDYDDKVHLGVTIDDDPGQELMRETGRFHFFFADEVELVGGGEGTGDEMSEQRAKDEMPPTVGHRNILVAAVGNAWRRDDGFGGARRQAPAGARASAGRRGARTSAPAASTSPTR